MMADWEEKNLSHRMISHCTTGGYHLYPVPQSSQHCIAICTTGIEGRDEQERYRLYRPGQQQNSSSGSGAGGEGRQGGSSSGSGAAGQEDLDWNNHRGFQF